VPTVKQLVGNSGSHHPRYHASKPPTPNAEIFPTSLNCASARERASEGARGDSAAATRMMMRTRLVTHATERFVRARHERRIAHDCVRAFSFVETGNSRSSRRVENPTTQIVRLPAPEIVRLRGARSRRSLWTTSSSTSRMRSTRRMWGNRSRRRRRCPNARRRTTDRYARHTQALPNLNAHIHLIADRHRNNPKRRRGRSARYGEKGVRADTLRSERSSSFPLGLACAHVHSLTS
jgi:hypothetical protein